MRIAILGAGYVGLTAGACFAKLGNTVWLVEKAPEKIRLLKSGRVPFFEPDLAQLLKEGIQKKKLFVTNDYRSAVEHAEVIFICVGTPTLSSGEADLSQVWDAAKSVRKHLGREYRLIVMKSTVPVGTAEKLKMFLRENSRANFDVASCPEFLREGRAVENTLHPDRIVIGAETERAKNLLLKLHKKLPGKRVITDLRTAELIKYASNAFLATKISFINEIANLCDAVGANVDDVALGMGLDPRIGKAFLRAGIGYGGSCFPKDIKALHHAALSNRYTFKLLKAVIEVNHTQRRLFLEKVRRQLRSFAKKNIGVLGLAFKNNTDDIRESAAMDIVKRLLKEGARVTAFDPKAMENAKKAIPMLKTAAKAEQVAQRADAILILTEWTEFQKLPWKKMKKAMRTPLVFDGRNLLDPKEMRKMGLRYVSVGRP